MMAHEGMTIHDFFTLISSLKLNISHERVNFARKSVLINNYSMAENIQENEEKKNLNFIEEIVEETNEGLTEETTEEVAVETVAEETEEEKLDRYANYFNE